MTLGCRKFPSESTEMAFGRVHSVDKSHFQKVGKGRHSSAQRGEEHRALWENLERGDQERNCYFMPPHGPLLSLLRAPYRQNVVLDPLYTAKS